MIQSIKNAEPNLPTSIQDYMCGIQSLASATFFMRSQILPPAEMNSLYGSMTRSTVISLLAE